ncbi:MAG: aminodeoxychorismate synthase component I [Gammaproteobacteria bacterium]
MCLSKSRAIPYNPDSARVFSSIADRPWSVFLDSGKPGSVQGRYDVISAEPVVTFVTRNGSTLVTGPAGDTVSTDQPFDLIREALTKYQYAPGDLPFAGGAIGYVGYGMARYLADLPCVSSDPNDMPDMCFAIYDWALVVDHQEQKSWLCRQDGNRISRQRWEELCSTLSGCQMAYPASSFRVMGAIRSSISARQYSAMFDRIQKYIHDGDCYQVNFAQKFTASCSGDPWHAYLNLREINPSPFGAYINTPYGQVLSSSPERFLRLSNRVVETNPIKGTRPRSPIPQQDHALRNELQNSAKDRAENLMIVDLLRNDLGKCCEPGSIEVPWLFRVKSFSRVHHMVSKITGRLSAGVDALSLLTDCFPGGSITGAPKYRAMEIIEELESGPRGVYCGSIGYIGFDGNMDTNIAIRTMVHQNGEIHFSAGGGIVADSTMESEYQESMDKASAMLDMLNNC